MFDAKPEDRDEIALWIKAIEIDHRPGPDGNLVPDVRVTFGKRGTTNYELHYWKSRLPKESAPVWAKFGPAIEKWEKDQTLPVDGLPLESWPAITKGMMRACKDLGLRSVEDVASATDVVREKVGMGFMDLQKQAKAFIATRKDSATGNRIADLEAKLAAMQSQLDEAARTNAALAAKQGKTRSKPAPVGQEAA